MGTMTLSAEGLLCFQEAAVKRGPLKEFWMENTLSDASLTRTPLLLSHAFTYLLFSPPLLPT